jgi:molybdopterin/thiamine biosynthesis adenylyltransferase
VLTNAHAIEAVSALFETFRPEYKGDRACEDAKGRPTGRHNWFFKVWDHDLSIVTDARFPYSLPSAYIVNNDFTRDLPHVEQTGRLCLTKVEFSTDPAVTARHVLAEALELLQAHQTGTEENDLIEDFTNYWSQRADVDSPALSLLYESGSSTGSYILAGDEIFAFPSRKAMLHWRENQKGPVPKHTNAAHFIELNRFPLPSEFPTSPESLLNLLKTHATDAGASMLNALSHVPKATVFVLFFNTPSARLQFAGLRLLMTQPPQKRGYRHKKKLNLRPGKTVKLDELLIHYTIQRLRTSRLDSSASRSVIAPRHLGDKRVVVIGCGALGSGVIRLLAKAGVGHLDVVDPDILGWENIRRHELGGRSVRHSKAQALASGVRQDFPEILRVRAFSQTIQDLLMSGDDIFEGADLIVATTGSMHADIYIDEFTRQGASRIPVVFGWMEAWGVAGHALLLTGNGARLIDGFAGGMPLNPSSRNDRQSPTECGNSTTPFGAGEVASVQAMVADVCLDRLLDAGMCDTWRTWWTSDRNLARTGGQWTKEFLTLKPAALLSGVMERQWP